MEPELFETDNTSRNLCDDKWCRMSLTTKSEISQVDLTICLLSCLFNLCLISYSLTFPPGSSAHLRKADIVFLLDSSSSIGKDNFHKLEDFLKDVASKLPVSQDGIHVGLMQYSSYPSLEFPLNLYSSRYDVLKAIDRVRLKSVHLSL